VFSKPSPKMVKASPVAIRANSKKIAKFQILLNCAAAARGIDRPWAVMVGPRSNIVGSGDIRFGRDKQKTPGMESCAPQPRSAAVHVGRWCRHSWRGSQPKGL